MRKELGFLAVLALYALIAYSTGITLPPDPWRSYICLLVLQSVLLWYSGPIGRRITDPVQNSGLTGPQQRLTNDIEAAANKIYFGLTVCAGTLVGIVAVFCCHESTWTGPRNVGEMVVMLITIGTECVVAGIFLGGACSRCTKTLCART
jgi:hypothetical protein